eukprot:c16856_g1_i1.p1 GENE.c16856_g1_i1~~c16856_g1_i1.p1  ORF type:complete len:279 (+),score=35.89 c16856_g1_i1:439-1275(+)
MGGVQRVCGVLGTSLGGALAQYYSFSVAFLAAAGFFALAGLSTIIVPGNSSTQSRTPSKQEAETQQSTASIVRRHWKNLTVGGLFALLLFALRTSSTYVFPLAAANMGLSIADVGYFSACQAAVDTSMFPVAGILVDRSRKLSAIPSVVIIAASYFLVPFCTKSWHLLGANALYGFGNGISSGLLMTIGQDLAPPDCRGKFIGLIILWFVREFCEQLPNRYFPLYLRVWRARWSHVDGNRHTKFVAVLCLGLHRILWDFRGDIDWGVLRRSKAPDCCG